MLLLMFVYVAFVLLDPCCQSWSAYLYNTASYLVWANHI